MRVPVRIQYETYFDELIFDVEGEYSFLDLGIYSSEIPISITIYPQWLLLRQEGELKSL